MLATCRSARSVWSETSLSPPSTTARTDHSQGGRMAAGTCRRGRTRSSGKYLEDPHSHSPNPGFPTIARGTHHHPTFKLRLPAALPQVAKGLLGQGDLWLVPEGLGWSPCRCYAGDGCWSAAVPFRAGLVSAGMHEGWPQSLPRPQSLPLHSLPPPQSLPRPACIGRHASAAVHRPQSLPQMQTWSQHLSVLCEPTTCPFRVSKSRLVIMKFKLMTR